MTVYDFVIVGGGTAGCVMAARLSEDGRHRVALVEAGRDTPPDQIDEAILNSYPRTAYFDARNIWAGLRVHLRPAGAGPAEAKRYEQARILGGGSSINDMQANRGTPKDYDDWAARGLDEWDWRSVLPAFRRVERDMDFGGPLHGADGPIPVRRIFQDAWPGFSRAAAEAFGASGFTELDDQNARFEDGFFPVAISNLYDQRVSSAIGYLDRKARQRDNLDIFTDTKAVGLVLDGTTVAGVEIESGTERRTIGAREVIVSAGALQSPALLMRAGVGPGQVLRDAGVEVRADRPGVGRNLQEHPTLSISAHISPEARLDRSALTRHIHVAMRYSSNVADCPESDMYMVAMCKTGWHPVGEQVGSLLTWVNKVYSRGHVAITSPRHEDFPHVDFAMLSDRRDVERLKTGVRLIARLYDTPPMRAVANEPFPTSYSERIRDLGVVNTKNLVPTTILAKLLDGPGWLRRALLRHVVSEEKPVSALLANEDLLEAFVRGKVHGVWHASGSCRMGKADDRDAVVDGHGRVFGVTGLRVVDASVMPAVPRANTNLPTLMIAERMSELILCER